MRTGEGQGSRLGAKRGHPTVRMPRVSSVRELVKVSVIVPVYNPGSNIDQCISSLLGQSLPDDEYEVIFVDDGSTDETPARLDELARAHPNVRVAHTPNSGWPGRPRNIGIDMAQGEFVYFVDNDDRLGPEALERLHRAALEYESDIVIGKVVGHGKFVARSLFRRNEPEVTLDWPPLLRLLTPHKLFRKTLLDEHRIRFPEGRRRLEDHVFVVHAYFHARRISVLSDYPCYHWIHRAQEVNASWQRLDPVGYFQNVREVLDLVAEHTDPGHVRDRLFAHWYRSKMLARVGGGPFVRREPQYRHDLYEEIRRLALERYGPDVDGFLPFHLRLRSYLLREGRYEALGALAEFENEVRAEARLRAISWADGRAELKLEAGLTGERDPLLFVRRGARMYWLPPAKLEGEFPEEMLDVTDELTRGKVQVLLRSTRNKAEYVQPTRSELVLLRAPADGDAKRPVLISAAEIDPRSAAAGSPLRAGDWQVNVQVGVADFMEIAETVSRPAGGFFSRLRRREPGRLLLTATRDGRMIERAELKRRVTRRLPQVTKQLRRFRKRGRAAIARVRRRVAV
jgi:poly(ribitol-phosphate) beta-N-acetylglucosaminyltransferase